MPISVQYITKTKKNREIHYHSSDASTIVTAPEPFIIIGVYRNGLPLVPAVCSPTEISIMRGITPISDIDESDYRKAFSSVTIVVSNCYTQFEFFNHITRIKSPMELYLGYMGVSSSSPYNGIVTDGTLTPGGNLYVVLSDDAVVIGLDGTTTFNAKAGVPVLCRAITRGANNIHVWGYQF